MTLFDIRDEITINCQKINYHIAGVSAVKVTVNDHGNVSEYFSLTPTNRNYPNDYHFFKSVLEPIIKEHKTLEKQTILNFTQGFPMLEALTYRKDMALTIRDEKVRGLIEDVSEILKENQVNLGGQFPLRSEKVFNENPEFESFRNKEKEINPNSINEILYKDSYIRKYGKEQNKNSLYIIKHVNKNLDQNYILNYIDKTGKLNSKKVVQFQSEVDKQDYFNNLFKELSKKDSTTIIYNNDPFLIKYNKQHNVILKKQSDYNAIKKYINIIRYDDIVNYLKKEDKVFTLNTKKIREKMGHEKNIKNKNIFSVLSGVQGKRGYEELKDKLQEKEISHVLLNKLNNENHENIFALVVENERDPETNEIKANIIKFPLDIEANKDDEEIFDKFKNRFEAKMGYRMSHVKMDNAQLVLENFEDRKRLPILLKEEMNTENISLSFESSTAFSNILNEYILENEENMLQKNKLLASDGPTSEDTLCVYSDASLVQKFKNEVTYGIVIRKPNSDKLIREVRGIKKFKNHLHDTIAGEQIGIIEAMTTIKKMMERGEIDRDLKIEFRVDNIDAVENFFDKNGKDKKVEEFFASEVYSKKEVNNLLSYFKEVDFKWIKGHVNDLFNERADKLAKSAWEFISSHGYDKHGMKKELSELNKIFKFDEDEEKNEVNIIKAENKVSDKKRKNFKL